MATPVDQTRLRYQSIHYDSVNETSVEPFKYVNLVEVASNPNAGDPSIIWVDTSGVPHVGSSAISTGGAVPTTGVTNDAVTFNSSGHLQDSGIVLVKNTNSNTNLNLNGTSNGSNLSLAICGVVTGLNSTGVGYNCKSRANDTVVGYNAGSSVSGGTNTIVGSGSCSSATAPFVDNVTIGYVSGESATSMQRCVLIGSSAGSAALSLTNTVMMGYDAGAGVSEATDSVLIGREVCSSAGTVDDCVVVGASSCSHWNGASNGVVIGQGCCGTGVATGAFTTAVGQGNLANLTSGSANTILGTGCGGTLTTGGSNVIIGTNCDAAAVNTTNALGISAAGPLASNTITVGNSSHTSATIKGVNALGSTAGTIITSAGLISASVIRPWFEISSAAAYTQSTTQNTAVELVATGTDATLSKGTIFAVGTTNGRIKTTLGLSDNYIVSFQCQFLKTVAANLAFSIKKNGTGSDLFAFSTFCNANNTSNVTFSKSVTLTTNDFISVYVNNTGDSANLTSFQYNIALQYSY